MMFFSDDAGWLWRRALIVGVVSLATALAAAEVTVRLARQDLERRLNTDAALRAAMLGNELERHRSLPFVLAHDAEIRNALRTANTPAESEETFEGLSERFERFAQHAGAATVYLLEVSGRTLAASNWRTDTSFVGENYSFRPYYRDAMKNGAAELFTLGTVSRVPGLYLARRIDSSGAGEPVPVGVIVVKVEFDELEAQWRSSGDGAYVTDERGVVLITNRPEWRFTTTRPLSQRDQAALSSPEQLGLDGPVPPFPTTPSSSLIGADHDAGKPGWTVHVLRDARKELATARLSGAAIGGFGGALLSLAVLVAHAIRAREKTMAARREAARQELEAQVNLRTRELKETNQRLIQEVDERTRAEATLHALQDELVQANKLAVLGQISAGVAHEINQPVAAIRSYVDNARAFLERAQPSRAAANLSAIASLTERIGTITHELLTFSRKSSGTPQQMRVDDAIAGALLLMRTRFRALGIKHVRNGESGLQVIAERARLEQVLVNLLQNAADALEGIRDAKVSIDVRANSDDVTIEIADNGPGVAPEALEGLFTPFATSKPKGLGLGLVISRDILAEFGGRLEHLKHVQPGASFLLTLRRAND
ncbi:MAG TPA: ATP-binding protein [Steroidobacter sp.]|uniref:sensor histidine kinase n=1 Tax=Steroidobacter sp. TaxID=1978227 RepID=UPI002EDA8BB4